jgi:hypothetical protein
MQDLPDPEQSLDLANAKSCEFRIHALSLCQSATAVKVQLLLAQIVSFLMCPDYDVIGRHVFWHHCRLCWFGSHLLLGSPFHGQEGREYVSNCLLQKQMPGLDVKKHFKLISAISANLQITCPALNFLLQA